jgi:hypothetical protein
MQLRKIKRCISGTGGVDQVHFDALEHALRANCHPEI